MKSFRSTAAELVFASTILFLSLSAIDASALSSRDGGYSDSMIRSSYVNDQTRERTEWLSSSAIRPVSVLEGELTDSLSQLRFFFENDGEGLAAIIWSEGLEFKGTGIAKTPFASKQVTFKYRSVTNHHSGLKWGLPKTIAR